MQVQEFDLSVGEALRIGDHVLTLIDVDGGEVDIRIDDVSGDSQESSGVPNGPPAK
jgi:hypothetical protein